MMTQMVAELLRKERQPFTPEAIRGVLQKHNLEAGGSVDTFVQAVFEEGARWTAKALEAFWEVLGDAPPPRKMSTIEECLHSGGLVVVSYLKTWGYPPGGAGVKVEVRREDKSLLDRIELYPPSPPPFWKGFFLNAWIGHVNFANYSGLHVVNDRVFFKEQILAS